MQQVQRSVEQLHQIRAGGARRALVGPVFKLEPRLDQFQIPIAKLPPEEIVNTIRRLVKAVSSQCVVHIGSHTVEPRKNPPIFQRLSIEASNARVGADASSVPGPQARLVIPIEWPSARQGGRGVRPYTIDVHEHESSRIPDLIRECPIPLSPALIERYVCSRRSHGSQREARRIRPKSLDNVERINHVALRL